jgi:hypothetical protein
MNVCLVYAILSDQLQARRSFVRSFAVNVYYLFLARHVPLTPLSNKRVSLKSSAMNISGPLTIRERCTSLRYLILNIVSGAKLKVLLRSLYQRLRLPPQSDDFFMVTWSDPSVVPTDPRELLDFRPHLLHQQRQWGYLSRGACSGIRKRARKIQGSRGLVLQRLVNVMRRKGLILTRADLTMDVLIEVSRAVNFHLCIQWQ